MQASNAALIAKGNPATADLLARLAGRPRVATDLLVKGHSLARVAEFTDLPLAEVKRLAAALARRAPC